MEVENEHNANTVACNSRAHRHGVQCKAKKSADTAWTRECAKCAYKAMQCVVSQAVCVCVVLCMLCRPRVTVDHPVPTMVMGNFHLFEKLAAWKRHATLKGMAKQVATPKDVVSKCRWKHHKMATVHDITKCSVIASCSLIASWRLKNCVSLVG